ncbi:AEC family transporter [Sediminibacillus massiliensis]|uniref:AEC family transporter n=1 Tax=Sediminibacillus massiliensis TaxID=1926277 RepID=UPI0009888644|nr:AEC family transporter [Sediminibacillus massiliensis]
MEFLGVLIPIFGVFALGFVGQKVWKFDIKPISTVAIYLMSPFLAFRTFYENEITLDYVYLSIYLAGLCLISIIFCYLLGMMRKWESDKTSSMILSSAFMNNGNYGAPLVLLIFGEEGFHYAVILMVLQQLIMCTVGIYYAAKGGDAGGKKVSPIKAVIKVPIVYGALLGIVFNLISIPIGDRISTAVDMVADATIPTVMIVLGMQLANITLKKLEYTDLSIALVIKLALAPAIAYLITSFLPMDEMVKQIMIITAATPTAANTTIYALQFNTRPGFVSSATLLSTLFSIMTIPVLMWIIL